VNLANLELVDVCGRYPSPYAKEIFAITLLEATVESGSCSTATGTLQEKIVSQSGNIALQADNVQSRTHICTNAGANECLGFGFCIFTKHVIEILEIYWPRLAQVPVVNF
jgi:hypothetical protein